jgi:hypothetical protein
MQIKVLHEGDCASVVVGNPATEEILHNVHLAVGQEVVITAINAHEASDLEIGDVVGGSPGEEEAPEEAAEPAAEEPVELPAGLGIGRVVIYRHPDGYDLPAVVTVTNATLPFLPPSTQELTSATRVHLTVFTVEGSGSYPEFNIPQFVAAELTRAEEAEEPVAGTWRWPERV